MTIIRLSEFLDVKISLRKKKMFPKAVMKELQDQGNDAKDGVRTESFLGSIRLYYKFVNK